MQVITQDQWQNKITLWRDTSRVLQEDRRWGLILTPVRGHFIEEEAQSFLLKSLSLDHGRIQEDSHEVEDLYRLGAHHK